MPASEHGIRSFCAQQRSLEQEIYFRYLADQIDDREDAGYRNAFITLADEQASIRRRQLFQSYTEYRSRHAWNNRNQQSVVVDPTDLTEPNRINEWSQGNTLYRTLQADMAVPQKIVRQSIIDDTRLKSGHELRSVSRQIEKLAEQYLRSGQDLLIVLQSQISRYLEQDYGQHWLRHVRSHYQEVHRPVTKYKSFRTCWYKSLRYRYHYLDKLSPVDAVPFVNFSVTGDHVYLLDQKLHLAHSCTDPVCRDFFLHLQSQMPNFTAYQVHSQGDLNNDPRYTEDVLRDYLTRNNRLEDDDSRPGFDFA
ncbi:hypothetical protein [Stieleria sedimenti]|uniref:hypothetical protein n=1 Tax=Stieleria sedimenti TaxID=2976331 RepID=UPI00217F7E99|nr:hypothetical protein [Stieleria sedimenti]